MKVRQLRIIIILVKPVFTDASFSCIDYEEDIQSGLVLSGYKHQKQYFSQLWYFDYNPSLGKWQADFIQPKDSAKSAWGFKPQSAFSMRFTSCIFI